MKVSFAFLASKDKNIWKKPYTELKKENLVITVKLERGGVMIWECMGGNGVRNLEFTDSSINKTDYLNIPKNLRVSAEKLRLSEDFILQQDNPKQTVYLVRLSALPCAKLAPSPSQSSDLFPIENLWDFLERKIGEYEIRSKEMLKFIMVEVWDKITKETFKLIETKQNKLRGVIKGRKWPKRWLLVEPFMGDEMKFIIS